MGNCLTNKEPSTANYDPNKHNPDITNFEIDEKKKEHEIIKEIKIKKGVNNEEDILKEESEHIDEGNNVIKIKIIKFLTN